MMLTASQSLRAEITGLTDKDTLSRKDHGLSAPSHQKQYGTQNG